MNMPKTMYILRGPSGSGKSTLAKTLNIPKENIFSTDDFFMQPVKNEKGEVVYAVTDENGEFKKDSDGHLIPFDPQKHSIDQRKAVTEYVFDPSKIKENHQNNADAVYAALKQEMNPIAVDNTFVKPWEFDKYLDMAHEHGYKVQIVEPGYAKLKNTSDPEQNPGQWDMDKLEQSQKDRLEEHERRKSHGFAQGEVGKQVPQEAVQRMVGNYVPTQKVIEEMQEKYPGLKINNQGSM